SNMKKWGEYSSAAGFGKEGDLIELGTDGYYIVDDAEERIDENYSYRTTTAKGDELLRKLQIICDGLNDFDTRNGPIKINCSDTLAPIKVLPTGEFVPSYEYISAFERF